MRCFLYFQLHYVTFPYVIFLYNPFIYVGSLIHFFLRRLSVGYIREAPGSNLGLFVGYFDMTFVCSFPSAARKSMKRGVWYSTTTSNLSFAIHPNSRCCISRETHSTLATNVSSYTFVLLFLRFSCLLFFTFPSFEILLLFFLFVSVRTYHAPLQFFSH